MSKQKTVTDIKPNRGSVQNRKRRGRGNASGLGGESGRGHKGQQSRSGYSRKAGFEGGQTPLYRRLPKRPGFKNPFKIIYFPLNIGDLEGLAKEVSIIDTTFYQDILGLDSRTRVKILGNGVLSKKLTIKAHRFSDSAKEKIASAGGSFEILS